MEPKAQSPDEEPRRLLTYIPPKSNSNCTRTRPVEPKLQFNTNVLVTRNNGERSSLKSLVDIKNLISTQLPKMPKNYITKLLFDQRHECLYLQWQQKVIGAACFRCFEGKEFVELVFLAVIQIYRENGLGSKIIDSLKQLLQSRGKTLMLTYADCTAVGFFKKQAFQFTLQDSSKEWWNYIKPYDGGLLMQCRVDLNFKYVQFRENLKFQKECLIKKIKSMAPIQVKYQVKRIQSIIRRKNSQAKFKNHQHKNNQLQQEDLQQDIDLELVPGFLDNLWSKQHQYELQTQKETSFVLQQLYALQCIRKLPGYRITEISQLPPAIAHLMTLFTVEKKINSNYYPNSQELVKELREMLREWKRWCPGEADDIFCQFSKKTNAILEKLLARKLQLKIEPMYRQGKTKNSKPTCKKK